MTNLSINPAATSFVSSLQGGDVPLAERRFLLLPIDGCAIGHDDPRILERWALADFSDDVGFTAGDREVASQIQLGNAMPLFDGIAQTQTVVRVV